MGFAVEEARELFAKIGTGLKNLHGHLVYIVFDRYLYELEADLTDLLDTHYLSATLEPQDMAPELHLPNFEKCKPLVSRHVWDYFVFLYMSHKYKNMKRLPGNPQLPTMVYLRGCDYEFAVTKEYVAVSYSTALDQQFQVSVLSQLGRYFNVLKALNSAEFQRAMQAIGGYLAAHGNSLKDVAEFARLCDEGFFMNSKSWQSCIVRMYPSSSVFLVYVSNQSRGLKFELESLLEMQLERNSVLILDSRRSDGRKVFFETQESLRDSLYASVIRDACVVDDVDEFERLLDRFPLKMEMIADFVDREDVYKSNLLKAGYVPRTEPAGQPPPANETKRREFMENLFSLIRKAWREPEDTECEIPFDFKIDLDAEAQEKFDAFRQYIAGQIDDGIARNGPSNWPALLLFIELDVFLSLLSNETCRAARSMARYGAIADFVHDLVRQSPDEETIKTLGALEEHGNMAMNAASVALSLGEWNDYRDRRGLTQATLETLKQEMHATLSRSAASAKGVKIRTCRPKTVIGSEGSTDAGLEFFKKMVAIMADKTQGPNLTLISANGFHRKE